MAAFISEMITSDSEFCITGGKFALVMDASTNEFTPNDARLGNATCTMTTRNEENSSGPEAPDTSGGNWTRPSITLLINVRKSMDVEFISGTTKHFKLWAKVATLLNNTGECKFTGVQCHSKWRNLVSTYTKNKIKLMKEGADAIKWEYFQAMDEARGKEFAVSISINNDISIPRSSMSPNNLLDTFQGSRSFRKNISANADVISSSLTCSSHEAELNSFNKFSKCNKSRVGLKFSAMSSEPPQWFKEYAEKLERQKQSRENIVRQIWEERKEFEAKKIQILHRLLQALTEE